MPYVKNMGRNLSKNLSGKYSKTPVNHGKQSAKDVFKTASKKDLLKKKAEATSDLIGE